MGSVRVNTGRDGGFLRGAEMILRMCPILLLAASVGACVGDGQKEVTAATSKRALATPLFANPSTEPLEKAKLYFQNENYGLAEVNFRAAVERDPKNQEAWLGLAASYDRLRRFDLAERAYGVIIRQFGYNVTVHNNLGYHHYLRGNGSKARQHFLAAEALEPDNPYVRNNLKLIEQS